MSSQAQAELLLWEELLDRLNLGMTRASPPETSLMAAGRSKPPGSRDEPKPPPGECNGSQRREQGHARLRAGLASPGTAAPQPGSLFHPSLHAGSWSCMSKSCEKLGRAGGLPAQSGKAQSEDPGQVKSCTELTQPFPLPMGSASGEPGSNSSSQPSGCSRF